MPLLGPVMRALHCDSQQRVPCAPQLSLDVAFGVRAGPGACAKGVFDGAGDLGQDGGDGGGAVERAEELVEGG